MATGRVSRVFRAPRALVLTLTLVCSCVASSARHSGGMAPRAEARPTHAAPLVVEPTVAASLVPQPLGSVARAQAPVLILYDNTGEYGYLGELYATALTALVSHFGESVALPVSRYTTERALSSRAIIYVGSTYGEPLPPAFLDDIAADLRPAMWLQYNFHQVVDRTPDFFDRFGFKPGELDDAPLVSIIYKGERLSRSADNREPLQRFSEFDSRKAQVLAWAETATGRRLPWAVRSRGLIYIGENPLNHISMGDRYLAFADLLFELLAPDTKPRHRALVRIEDVHPLTSTRLLRQYADYFARERVPFAVAVIAVYADPLGFRNRGRPKRVALRDSPAMIATLKYMVRKGGTLIAHGYTHQFERKANPYGGTTGEDFEFYAAHLEGPQHVVQDGPVPGDSAEWAEGRVRLALAEFEAAGLPRPKIFEFPHYAGSDEDSRAIAAHFPASFHPARYWNGLLTGDKPDYSRSIDVFFPFVVRDPYGWKVLPENLGHYAPADNEAPHAASQFGRDARTLRVVRDGIAGFFFHPMYEVSILAQIVSGIRDAGYTFVSAAEL